jgi:hypothetical protein
MAAFTEFICIVSSSAWYCESDILRSSWNQWVLQNESCPTMAPILPRPDKNIVAQFSTFGKLYKRLNKKEKKEENGKSRDSWR